MVLANNRISYCFFQDNDYIERGSLSSDKDEPRYNHSWICFKYKGCEYVLDPCLNFICKKKDYNKIFEGRSSNSSNS